MISPPSFPRVTTGETREQGKHELFAPHPNLSLNVGTRRTRKPFLLGIVAAGLFLQGSFFVYATWATFYNARFYTDSDRPLLWSFILGMTGTLLLACGMCLCAVLVERRSTERRFQVVQRPDDVKPRVYWLQCGNQRVGDQLFHSFAFSKEKTEYITSCISEPDAMRIFHLPPSLVLWVAILLSVTGFVCQFAGFRGLHGSITLYQLACTLMMSIIRSVLRSRRLRRDQNLLKGFERVSDSNELDWQALCMAQDETVITDGKSCSRRVTPLQSYMARFHESRRSPY
jgi:heme/copper-type cytochrome/quinol oxidase subunit 3